MIAKRDLASAMYGAMKRAATQAPPDIEAALRNALAEEPEALAKAHLESCLANFRSARKGRGLVCGDTGFPLYFVRAGAKTAIEGGFGTLWDAAREATARATGESLLRPTMVDPLTRNNPGDNIGPGMPKVELRFDGDGDGVDIVAVPKGGGSEIFGTFYRMLFPSDGETGVMKFVVDRVRESCYAGKICPPAIIGVGIGGTADLCVKMAKEAALLRPVGSRHPEPRIAALEDKLKNACRSLGIGPMGARGVNAVLAIHVEIAVTHTAALPVAVNAQCLVGRRWGVRVEADGTIVFEGEKRS